MPFAAALSEHPRAAPATGEVVGRILEQLGPAPDLVVLAVSAAHIPQVADIAATVDHVRETDPDVFFTTVSYPIRGTPYFDRVASRVAADRDWADSTDRDLRIAGRRDRDYYRVADEWLRAAVAARRSGRDAPEHAAPIRERAERARLRLAQLTVAP